MSLLKEKINTISSQILDYLLTYRQEHPGFTFSLRERDFAGSEETRLEAGQWFQGSSYIYVPLFSRGDSARKIKTLGFVITFETDGAIEDNYIEVSFKGGVTDPNEINFHKELAEELNVPLSKSNHGEWYYDEPDNYLENLKDYVERVYPLAISLLEKYQLKDQYLVEESRFLRNLERINRIRIGMNQMKNITTTKANALNLILYGPPGTGKTYNAISKAVELACGKTFDNHLDYKEEFDKLRKMGQIEFVTFHQNYSYEDFISGITPDISTSHLRFDRKEGVFKKLVSLARANWQKSQNRTTIHVDFNMVFNSFFSQLIAEESDEITIPMRSKGWSFKITSVDLDEGRIKFTKQSGGKGHDLLVKNVRAIYDNQLDYGNEGLGVYYYPLVEKLREYAQTLAANIGPEDLKNYVLIIDEINRANVSKVFGEIITLLEEDKRLGAENELKITLQNGEPDFGIPPNLYILGTMNTADKSIALVDIALRRRFEFVGHYPTRTLLGQLQESSHLTAHAATLLQHLNAGVYRERNSAEYLIGHAYFIKKQDAEVPGIIRLKIIPLLMEYFSGRVEKVAALFENSAYRVRYSTEEFDWIITPGQANVV